MPVPGFSLLDNSEEAAESEKEFAIPFFEARVEANGHYLELVFSDLVVTRVVAGFAPFKMPRTHTGMALSGGSEAGGPRRHSSLEVVR